MRIVTGDLSHVVVLLLHLSEAASDAFFLHLAKIIRAHLDEIFMLHL
jgi:hypothetical protein